MKYINKDIIQTFNESEEMILVHQCNWTKGMGAGIAKYLCLNFQGLNEFDISIRKELESKTLKDFLKGFYKTFEVESNKKIVNIYSQYDVGYPNKTNFDSFENRKIALKNALLNLSVTHKQISMPLIASGLAKHKDYKFMKDLDYFKYFIEPILKDIEFVSDCEFLIYYL